MGLFAWIRSVVGYSVAGTAAYTYGRTQQATEYFGNVQDGLETASRSVAEGLAGMAGAVRDGFTSAQRVPSAPQPYITHVYHDRNSKSGGTLTVVVVTGGVGLAVYYVICKFRGWSFFGFSDKQAQELIKGMKDSVMKAFDDAASEISRLRGKLDEQADEQAKQTVLLQDVNEAVTSSGVQLDALGIQNEDIVHALRRAEANNEAMGRGMMAIQYFLAAVSRGDASDRETAMRMLESSFQHQMQALPSNQAGAASMLQNGNGTAAGTPSPEAAGSPAASRSWGIVASAGRFVSSSLRALRPGGAASDGATSAALPVPLPSAAGDVAPASARPMSARPPLSNRSVASEPRSLDHPRSFAGDAYAVQPAGTWNDSLHVGSPTPQDWVAGMGARPSIPNSAAPWATADDQRLTMGSDGGSIGGDVPYSHVRPIIEEEPAGNSQNFF